MDKTEADISIKLSWEHKKYRWMTLSELLDTNIPEDADPYYIDVIDYLKHLSETWFVRHIFPYSNLWIYLGYRIDILQEKFAPKENATNSPVAYTDSVLSYST